MKKYWLASSVIFLGYLLVINPYLYKEIIDVLSSGAAPDAILSHALHLVLLVAGGVLLYNVGYRTGDYMNSYVQSKVMKELNDATFERLLKHSYHFFSNNFSGSLVAKAKRFTKSFETLADVVTYQIFFSVTTIIGISIVLFLKAPLLAQIFVIWSVVYIGISFLFIRRKILYDVEEAEADSRVTGHLADAILNVLNIKIFGGDKNEKEKYEVITENEEQKRRKAWYFGNLQNSIQALLMAILRIGTLVVSVYLWYQGQITLGIIVLLQIYLFNLFDILWNLGKSLTKAVKALTDMKEIVDIFDQTIDIADPENPEPVRITQGAISFENVSFEYAGGIRVFENLNLEVTAGERIGLVGHSGAGKSTITKLLLRFADVSDGTIAIDGQDIRTIAQNDLRSAIAYVPQESILFHRSIKDNIAYGRQEASSEEIEVVAQKAHAHEFISKLPHGYDTLVGERGVKLSGGERQRVAIARAMIKNAPILILDEATSSLDSISEGYIQQAFTELMKGKTTLVIAHRLSTIQKMDRIIVLEEGAIAEMGTHKELIEKGGVYANLWNHQSGGFIE
ncbi:MAG: ABC transporter ATP-binding protein [Patescibacteria group bacterium]